MAKLIKREDGKVTFTDDFICDLSQIKDDLKRKFLENMHVVEGSVSMPPLIVTVAATHAGIITRNGGFYRPDTMKKHLPSFVEDGYPKPVLLHHDERSDPVGRVRRATYQDLSYKYSEPIREFKSRYGGTVFMDGSEVDTDKSFDQIKWVMKNLVPMKDYVGLGYGELDLHITDPDTATKILDERYLTVSVGFTSSRVYCSICKSDLASEERCEHELGKTYDGYPMAIVPDNFNYEELSYINSPADKFAQNISVRQTSGAPDEPQKILYSKENAADFITIPILTSIKDQVVYRLDTYRDVDPELAKEVLAVTKPTKKEATQEQDQKQKEKVELEVTKDSSEEDVLTDDLPAADETKDTTETEEKVEDITETDKSKEKTEDQVTDTEDSTEDETQETEDETFEEWDYETVVIPELEKLTEETGDPIFTDAKLSAEQRKKLGSKTFCGPGRSFPVNDCAHYTAALRLLSRYKGEGSKSRIRACIMRRGKSLGCGKKSDAFEPVTIVIKQADEKELEVTFTNVEDLRNLVTKTLDKGTVENNRDEILKAAKIFGFGDDALDEEKGLFERIAQAEDEGNGQLDENAVDAIVQGLMNLPDPDRRTELANKLIDALVEHGILEDIYEDYSRAVQELDEANNKIASLMTANRDFYASRQESLARLVCSLRAALNKPGFEDIANSKDIDEKVKELKIRSVDSLNDALEDLLVEVSKGIKPTAETEARIEDATKTDESETKETTHKVKDDASLFKGLTDSQIRLAQRLRAYYKQGRE